jgi:hypothetical protein
MLREETLQPQAGEKQYEEPDGEFLEVISSNTNTITVLTRVDNSGKAGAISPGDYTVAELDSVLDGGFTREELEEIRTLERNGKGRITAVDIIEDHMVDTNE